MSDNNNYFEGTYLRDIIRWGRITNWTGLVVAFGPVLVLAVVFDLMPPLSAIGTAFIMIASAVGVIWFVEPISYFPILGVSGTYMAFISGNISNLRIPCAMIAQKVAGVEAGTNEGSIIATLGMATSIAVNIIILTAGVLGLAQALASFQVTHPEAVASLQMLLPALFGAIFTQFAIQKLKLAPIVLIICILLVLAVQNKIIPGYLSTLIAVAASIGIAVAMYKKGILK